jgi:hypothetical protein
MSHDAVRIVGGDLLEFFFGFFVPKRVKQSYAALEGLLHCGGAGDWESDGAELGGGEVFVVMVSFVIIGGGSKCQERREKKEAEDMFHRNPRASLLEGKEWVKRWLVPERLALLGGTAEAAVPTWTFYEA